MILGDARLETKLDLLHEFRGFPLEVPTRGYLVSATPFSAIAARRPGEARESLRERGILIQGENSQDVQHILRELISLVQTYAEPLP